MERLPDLRIKHKGIKEKARYDLRRFLYPRPYSKNGKALDARWFFRMIDEGALGPAKMERLELVIAIKEVIEFKLARGGATASTDSYLAVLQLFFDFCHNNSKFITIENVEEIYLEYCEYLFQKSHIKHPFLSKKAAYGYGTKLSNLFGEILEIPVGIELIGRSRLSNPETAIKAVSKVANKQNLEDTAKMGGFLVDLISGITIDKIYGDLPFSVSIRDGLVENNEISLNLNVFKPGCENLLLLPADQMTSLQKGYAKQILKARKRVDSIKGTKRHYFVSLRISAEFFVFIAQTGMNVSQARLLSRSKFKYKPLGESWEVKAYKHRRGGEVSFKIYKSYKTFLQEHMKFVEHFFPDSKLLFPWHNTGGSPSESQGFTYQSLYKLLKKHGIPWISPQNLRKTRVNWCLRRSGGDVALTAEMHQHFVETLRENYERPSLQRAMIELTRFWKKNDPIKEREIKVSLISGICNGVPVVTADKPAAVVAPNCGNQSGCLWCQNLRDLDSFDYVWSLASFRHLKTIEAAGVYLRGVVPTDLVIGRLSEKIEWYRQASRKRAKWVNEAEARIAEGDYHPHWSRIIEFLE